MLKKWFVFALVTMTAAAMMTSPAHAQVVQAETGGPALVSVGGSFADFSPDFTLKRLYGFGAYADVVPLRTDRFNLGLEGEWHVLNIHQVSHVHERSLSIGPIVSAGNIHGFRPFAKVMYGLGNFYYPYFTSVRPSFYTDSYGIWVFGGGVDYRLNRRLTVRGQYEYQDWTHFRGAKTLNPNGPSIGISYRVF